MTEYAEAFLKLSPEEQAQVLSDERLFGQSFIHIVDGTPKHWPIERVVVKERGPGWQNEAVTWRRNG